MNIQRIPLQHLGDARGDLAVLEEGASLPFSIRRVYLIYGTQDGVTRGLHAHRTLTQVAVAVRGSCRMILDNGRERAELQLDDPCEGVLIGPMIWREMDRFSEDCVLMVLADQVYDEGDYIRDYQAFVACVRAGSLHLGSAT